MALLDNETVVDLQSDEGTDPNQPLIPSSRCSSNIKKLISAGFIILLCLSFITWLAVWESEKELFNLHPQPPFALAPFQQRPLPKNATDMTAKDLLSLVFDKHQLEYMKLNAILNILLHLNSCCWLKINESIEQKKETKIVLEATRPDEATQSTNDAAPVLQSPNSGGDGIESPNSNAHELINSDNESAPVLKSDEPVTIGDAATNNETAQTLLMYTCSAQTGMLLQSTME
ncbi:hypothetical protein Ocin01_16285 [Orchesella cincta]|uniref:Uncharacterized protein n=1 Tax=Orchesella cincta TaxID=48709 RepID=A0A1D2MBM2_ORCCI|nr:hypothetical protein Ocin01_16285 [Orchesella cincta]